MPGLIYLVGDRRIKSRFVSGSSSGVNLKAAWLFLSLVVAGPHEAKAVTAPVSGYYVTSQMAGQESALRDAIQVCGVTAAERKAISFSQIVVEAWARCFDRMPNTVFSKYFNYYKLSGIEPYSVAYTGKALYRMTSAYDGHWIRDTPVFIYTTNSTWCEDGSAPNTALPLEQQCSGSRGNTLGEQCPSAGNPISLGSGNKFQSETDYVLTTESGIFFRRYYNSQDNTSGVLGIGWRHNYERRLYIGDSIRAVRADGRINTFINAGSTWVSDPDVADRLATITNGWAYTTPNGTVERYDSQGRLLRITDRAGRSQLLRYNAAGELTQVTDAYGGSLELGYDADGRLTTIQAPAGSSYAYRYSGGRLSRTTYPDGSQRHYRYDDSDHPNALTAILDDAGTLIASWTYDAGGRATSSVHADGADNTLVAYNADGTVTVTNALGKQTTYHFANYFGVPKVVQVQGHPTATCAGANQLYTYDTNGFLASKTDWNGITTTYTHDTQGRELSRTEAAGTPEARTVTTEWHSQWHLPVRISEPGKVTVFTYGANGLLVGRAEQSVQ